MRPHMTPLLAALALLALTTLVTSVAVDPVVAQPRAGVYSEAQAARGEALYADNCSYCHLVDLTGGELSPALTGPPFIAKWTSRPLGHVFDYMRVEMPYNSPGGLSAQQNADILAFLLKRSGFPAGAADLPGESAALQAVTAARP